LLFESGELFDSGVAIGARVRISPKDYRLMVDRNEGRVAQPADPPVDFLGVIPESIERSVGEPV